MIHMSMDQATNKFALSVFDNEKLIHSQQYELSKYIAYEEMDKRLSTVNKIMIKAIKEYKVEFVVLEDIFLKVGGGGYSGYNSFKTLAQLLGILTNSLYDMGMLYTLVKASEWRKTCGIKGKDKIQKVNCINFVKDKFGLDVPEDEAEAIGISYHTAKKILPKIKVLTD
jgi:Holliday junction resolvasome RuvABC endonuclease subunit